MRFYIRNSKDGNNQEFVTIDDDNKEKVLESYEARNLMKNTSTRYLGYDDIHGTGEEFITFLIRRKSEIEKQQGDKHVT